MSRPSLENLLQTWKQDPDSLSDLDFVVLTYARAKGLTKESTLEQKAAEELFGNLLDTTPPETFDNLKDYNQTLGETHLRNMMRETMQWMANDLKRQADELDLLDQSTELEPTDLSKTRKRDRDR